MGVLDWIGGAAKDVYDAGKSFVTKEGGGLDLGNSALVLGAASMLFPQGREFMLGGKQGEFQTQSVDPNHPAYRDALLESTNMLRDPMQNEVFQNYLRAANAQMAPGVRAGTDKTQAVKAALMGANMWGDKVGEAYGASAPITAYSPRKKGFLETAGPALGAFFTDKGSSPATGLTEQPGALDFGSNFSLNTYGQGALTTEPDFKLTGGDQYFIPGFDK